MSEYLPLHYRDPKTFFSQLQDEVNALKDAPTPTWSDWGQATIPGRAGGGFLTHRDKTPDQRLNDFKKAYMLEKLVKAWGDPASENPNEHQWRIRQMLPAELATEMTMYAQNRDGYRDHLNSGYEDTGWMGRGSTFNDFSLWSSSIPATAYHVGEMIANQVDPEVPANPNAGKDLEQTLGTFAAPFSQYTVDPWANKVVPGHKDSISKPDYSHWNSAATARGTAHQVLGPQLAGPSMVGIAGELESNAGSPMTGEQYLEKHASKVVPSKATRRVLGTLMDGTLNPYWSGPAVSRSAATLGRPMARLGQLGTAEAWKILTADHALGAGLAGLQTAAEAMQDPTDAMIERLDRAR